MKNGGRSNDLITLLLPPPLPPPPPPPLLLLTPLELEINSIGIGATVRGPRKSARFHLTLVICFGVFCSHLLIFAGGKQGLCVGLSDVDEVVSLTYCLGKCPLQMKQETVG